MKKFPVEAEEELSSESVVYSGHPRQEDDPKAASAQRRLCLNPRAPLAEEHVEVNLEKAVGEQVFEKLLAVQAAEAAHQKNSEYLEPILLEDAVLEQNSVEALQAPVCHEAGLDHEVLCRKPSVE